jgi:eukaryotic-like serine/threonine-protein kinase
MVNTSPAGSTPPLRHALAVGKYRVLAELGRGGMANVFLSVIRGRGGVGKLVVIKSLLPELARDSSALGMFLDEARLSTQLNHGNVVQTYEIGTEGERHVIVMEYLDGQPLSAILQRCSTTNTPLPIALYLRVILHVLDGLHYAHELRSYDGTELALVHRDVSPHNVFVSYHGQVKVLDFGIAKASTSSSQTSTGLLKGKIAYMAPEQMAGSDLDRRADIYAVGCLLWELAAGSKLWKDVPNAVIFRKVMNGEIPSPRSVNPECDDELERIVMKALSPDPGARFATALDLHDQIEKYAARFPRPKGRDIGDFIAQLFAEQRAELKARLERQLASLGDDGQATSSSLGSPTDLTTAADVSLEHAPEPPPQRWRRTSSWLALGLGIVGAASTVAWIGKPSSVSSAALGTTAPASAAAREKTASVTFEGVPAEAQLVLDGEPIGRGKVVRRLPQGSVSHELTATADGHLPETRIFTVTQDTTITVRLASSQSRAAASSAPPSKTKKGAPSSGQRVSASHVSAAPLQPKPDCSQAFFIDASGTRRVRRECLQ